MVCLEDLIDSDLIEYGKHTKFIVVSGGGVSGLGKGIVAASVGRLLDREDQRVACVKLDGYLNQNPGTQNPREHGEVWVTHDGLETDLDLGHYERFGVSVSRGSNVTSGIIERILGERERAGVYQGQTIRVSPHKQALLLEHVLRAGHDNNANVVIVEIGGTVGDPENTYMYKALGIDLPCLTPKSNIAYVHCAYIVEGKRFGGQQKTLVAQRSIDDLRSVGIHPNVVVAVSDSPLLDAARQKLEDINGFKVVSDPYMESVYGIPLLFREEGLDTHLATILGVRTTQTLDNLKGVVDRMERPSKGEVTIGIVGKYMETEDAYLSIKESLKHAGAANDARVNLVWIDSETLEASPNKSKYLGSLDGIVVPGGYGARGTEGKIAAAQYARENNVPYLGICFGMQLAVVEFARNVCGLEGASSTEFNNGSYRAAHPVIAMLKGQEALLNGQMELSGTQRLGGQPAVMDPDSRIYDLYAQAGRVQEGNIVTERHRHRYEVNPAYHQTLRDNGMVLAGMSPDGNLVEFMELRDHPYFVGTQAHPEMTSRPENPGPMFVGLVKSAMDYRNLKE